MAGVKVVNTIKAAGKSRVLNVRPDAPDIRDRYYEPSLLPLAAQRDKRGGRILDQGTEGSCTGFALAGVINLLSMMRGQAFEASPRMLYEMARNHDEWPGEDYDGSSCRGAIKGWRNMGVCSEDDWPYVVKKPDVLTIARAMSARENPLGAYYRLRPNVVDYHAALNEVDAIYVSARVHAGWFTPKSPGGNSLAVIVPDPKPAGGHAFAIVGYNSIGFIVQNSWGEKWGTDGCAIWTYADWQESISDGWVFRLAIPTPTIFGRESARTTPSEGAQATRKAPKRHVIAGHFAHFDDGRYQQRGNYWTTAEDIQFTANRIKANADWYDHVLIYAHGGLNSPKASASRIAELKDGFMRNRIYPFHIMYDTGLAEEMKELLLRACTGARARAEGFLDWIKDQIVERTDTLIEDGTRKVGTALWDEMKRDAFQPFDLSDGVPDGLEAVQILADTLKGTGMKFHLAGHSAGGIVLGHLLNALDSVKEPKQISTCTLLAPACSVDFFNRNYAPRLSASHQGKCLQQLDVYNLTDKQELDDNVIKAYRKSLLYLFSNAYERNRGKPLLGMQKFSKPIKDRKNLEFIYSRVTGKVCRSTTHGGFDNDTTTMNSLLKRILGKAPEKPFNDREMKGY